MFKYALVAATLATASNAQELSLKRFYTVQDCGEQFRMFDYSAEIGEQPLFIGTSTMVGIEGEYYNGSMMFTVNQDTGTWTMFTQYADGTVCITAFGDFFEPAP